MISSAAPMCRDQGLPAARWRGDVARPSACCRLRRPGSGQHRLRSELIRPTASVPNCPCTGPGHCELQTSAPRIGSRRPGPAQPQLRDGRVTVAAVSPSIAGLVNLLLDGCQKRLDPTAGNAAPDEHHAAAAVDRRPARQQCRGMEHVLHAVDDGRPVRALGEVDDRLEPQQVARRNARPALRGTASGRSPGSAARAR